MKIPYLALFLSSVVATTSLSGIITFSIDTFTSDELTLTLQEGGSFVGPAPSSNSAFLFIHSSSDTGGDWIISSTAATQTASGSIEGNAVATSPFFANRDGSSATTADHIELFIGSSITVGSTIDPGGITITLTGTDLFDPAAIPGLEVVWGGFGSMLDSGTIQSTAVVPEPKYYAALSALMALCFVIIRRRS